jgi:hypothetical protein
MTYSKVTKRLIPLLSLCYFVAYLDRVNVSFAKLQMLDDLKLSDTVYGLGSDCHRLRQFAWPFPLVAFDLPSELVTRFPLVLIPVFGVPVCILLHFASLMKLRRASASLRDNAT